MPHPAIVSTTNCCWPPAQEIGEPSGNLQNPASGFLQTPLEEHLRRLGVNTLVITGSNYPNCPRATIYEASERDFRIVAVTDAVSLLDDRGIAELEAIGVLCIPSGEVPDRLLPRR